jgi:hypothetical protein
MSTKKSRKIRWHRSKDGGGMPHAYCEFTASTAGDFVVLCEVTHLHGDTFDYYIDAPGYVSPEYKVVGFENAIKKAEEKILDKIHKACIELQAWNRK